PLMRPILRKGLLVLAISFPVLARAESPAPRVKPEEAAAEHGKLSAEDLAKMTQNPVANLISVPFQWNMGFGAGPYDSYQSTLNIQPVIPITINEDWNLITRTIFPVVSWPAPSSDNHVAGIGDTTFTAFLSPGKAKGFIWGVGPAFLFPTASSADLGDGKWGLGPSIVALYMHKSIVAGALINNIWSFAGWGAGNVNAMTLQPFFNYNFPGGWYFSASPIITANWAAESSRDVWTVPVGGGFGKIIHLGRLPVNISVQAFYNVATPRYGADWSIRLQCQFLFPR
ncbi:MAG: hypothetical protein WCC08_19760, partial [Terrimicrobiaceae bacterium]